jgi:hypothetical protein
MAFRRSPEYQGRAKATQAQYRVYLRIWDELGHIRAQEITRRSVLTLRDAVAGRSGPGAANAFARITSALFAWSVDRGWRDHNPAARIKSLPSGTIRAWTAPEAERAARLLPPHLGRVVVLARYSGQRRADLCGLTWAAYDGAALRLRQGKTGTALVIPCHPELRATTDPCSVCSELVHHRVSDEDGRCFACATAAAEDDVDGGGEDLGTSEDEGDGGAAAADGGGVGAGEPAQVRTCRISRNGQAAESCDGCARPRDLFTSDDGKYRFCDRCFRRDAAYAWHR